MASKKTKLKNNNKVIIILALLTLLSMCVYYLVSQFPGLRLRNYNTSDNFPTTQPILNSIILLNEQNSSGEYGRATLTEQNETVTIKVEVANALKGASLSAHIHVGSCESLGNVLYGLKNVINGVSITTLNVTLEELQAKLPLAINIHNASDEYVSCGDFTIS